MTLDLEIEGHRFQTFILTFNFMSCPGGKNLLKFYSYYEISCGKVGIYSIHYTHTDTRNIEKACDHIFLGNYNSSC